ncbi:MAG: hypothetical protein JWQ19_2041 [Subtercola sp.]|nr:hypothetical protein [Subtercola sp.]
MSENSASGQGESWEVPIERGKIREFAAAMQSSHPAYQGAGAVVPPTFLVTGRQWAPDGVALAHGFDRSRLLHGGQEFVFYGPPPHAGDLLYASERIAERYEKQGKKGGTMRFLVIVTDFRDADGDVVAESRSTLIERAASA